jgi:hypothetical protein
MTNIAQNAAMVIEEFYIAAKRNRPDRVFDAIACRVRPDRLAEADGETQNTHAKAPRDPEMAEFVEGDQQAQGD